MAVTQIKKDVFLHKASHLYYTPWVYTAAVGSTPGFWAPGTATYDIVDILADTISIEQGDPTTETIDWEFGDTPLLSSSTKGERSVTADCIDMSFDIMKNVFKWTVDANNVMASEGASGENYATMVVAFHSQAAHMIVLPKVSMNAKTTIGTLKTSTGSAQLAGTAMSAYISASDGTNTATGTTEFAFVKPTDGGSISVANSSGDTPVKIGDIDLVNNEFVLV